MIDRTGGPWTRLQNTRVHIGNVDINEIHGELSSNSICFEYIDEPTNNEATYPCTNLMIGQFLLIEKFGPTENPNGAPYAWHVNEVNIFVI